MKWVHFIHNKVNVALDLPELTMEEAMSKYYDNYKPRIVKTTQEYNRREKIAFISGAGLILIAIYFGLNK